MNSKTLKRAATAGVLFAAATAHSATLSLVVEGVEETEGALMIAVFDSAEAFDKGGEPVEALMVEVDTKIVTVTLDDLAPGSYAVKMYHDANSNGEMDTNMMGIPSEMYGFSGNKGRFGPPPFADATVEVTDDAPVETTIRLR